MESWKDIEHDIGELNAEVNLTERNEFWSKFGARIGDTERDTAVVALPALLFPVLKVAASFMFIATLLYFAVPQSTQGATATVTEVKELNVYADYSAMMILGDEQESGTMIWISDMNIAN